MKKNLPITQIEESYDDSANILSTTDLKGAISYVSDDFVSISGFRNEELIGCNHNMVRHPDMPPAAFEDLWKTVKTGQSWMGIVKNRCKNGNHYWVDAYVTPIFKDGQIKEYQSVRRQPDRAHVERAEKLYPPLLLGKTPALLKRTPLALQWKITLMAVMVAMLAGSAVFFPENSLIQGLCVGIALLIAFISSFLLLVPLSRVVEDAKKVISNPVAQYIYTGRMDEAGQLALALKMLESESAGLIGRIADTSSNLNENAAGLKAAVGDAHSGVEKQFAETDQVAAAITEMTASIQEVAVNAQSAADAAGQGWKEAEQGKQVIDSSVQSIEALKSNVLHAGEVIRNVEQSSNNISAVLDVIHGVSEQTNLLALNAAIEAARAGDQGRGFAVVADEVRTLATRTQASTEEIQTMIESMQSSARQAVSVMEESTVQADSCVEQGSRSQESLNVIHDAINVINDMSTQIAAAVEEQSAVADEINRSVVSIRDLSEKNLDSTKMNAQTSDDMSVASRGLEELAIQFWNKA